MKMRKITMFLILLLLGNIATIQANSEDTWTLDLLSKPYWTKTLQRTFIGDVVLSENTGRIYISSISSSAIYLTAVDFYGNIIWDIKLRELSSAQMLDADLSLHVSSNGQYVVISPRILGKDIRVYELGTYVVDIHGNIVNEFSETYSIQGVFNDGSILISDGVLKKIDIFGQIVTEFVGTKAYVSSESVIGIEDSNVLYFMSLDGNILHRHQIEGFITDVKIFDKYVLVATQNFQVEMFFGISGTMVRFSRGPIRSRIYLFSLRGELIYTSQELRGMFNAGAIEGDTLLLAMTYGDILEQESGTSGGWAALDPMYYYYRINIKSGETKYKPDSLPVLCVVFPKGNSKNTAVIASPTSLSVLKIDSMSISTITNVSSRKICSPSLIISLQKTTLSAYLLVAPSMLGHSSLESSITPEKEELTSTFTPKYEEYNDQIDGVKGYKYISPEIQKKLADYAIQKAEELIGKIGELGYEINFAAEILQQAKDFLNKGNYKNARDLARKAWLVALQEWQIQYEAEILGKAGINVDSPLRQYRSGNMKETLNSLNHLSSQLSGVQKALFDSVHNTFEVIKEYWNNGILLYNAVDELIESNKEFKNGNLDKAKNLADSALKTAKDLGETARAIKKKLEEVARAIYEEGRGGEKAKELFERAVELFERGDFEKVQEVIEEIIVIIQKGKSGSNTTLIVVALLVISGVLGVIFIKRR